MAVVSKIIEKIVHKRLTEFLNKHNLLSKQQFDFISKRSKQSTELAATLFTDNIRKSVDDKMLVGSVFIDFSKAFDSLLHSKLLHKLPAYGITGIEFQWFTNYIFNRKHIVSYNDQPSKMSSITCGVPQGSILGPLLLVIFVNNI